VSGQTVLDVRRQLRLLLLLLRPALVFLLVSFGLLGLSMGGHQQDLSLVVPVTATVLGFLLFAVALNDVADREVDRINLPGESSRPLSSGAASYQEMILMAAIGGSTALAAAAWLGRGPLLVTAVGVLLAAAYSLEPFSLSRRGAAASLILPAGFVAVPFLVGILAAHRLSGSALCVLAGLYVGFIGRILLKDFRDVVGDSLLGKRTFLVRHGRVVTCRLSAVFWAIGSGTVVFVAHPSAALDVAYGVQVVLVLFFLRQLARSDGGRQDEAFISAIAILGRGCMTTLLAHYALLGKGSPGSALFLLALAGTSVLFAWTMAQGGPVTRLYVPTWINTAGGRHLPVPSEDDRSSVHVG
jgi:4-hydroxybenzoate polyprenyltransferase